MNFTIYRHFRCYSHSFAGIVFFMCIIDIILVLLKYSFKIFIGVAVAVAVDVDVCCYHSFLGLYIIIILFRWYFARTLYCILLSCFDSSYG